MSKNTNLNMAGRDRKDEFYTQLTDIEKEMRHYRKHFKDQTIFCNCDDPFESNFFKYFVLNFNRLGLKKLIATCYTGSPIANQQLSLFDISGQTGKSQNRPYKAVVTTVYDKTGDGGVDMLDVAELFKSGENELSELAGDGDFRSPECLALMDEADIVVTNPPFSLFREYVATLMEHGKKFIIIGNVNAITYKEFFPLLRDNKVWLGMGFHNGDAYFRIPEKNARDFAQGVYNAEAGLVHFRNCTWFTNLDIKKRHEEMILVRRYNPEDYPKYDNYDAIEVSKTVDIPCDYAGVMGVPISWLDKYNPDQFEIIGMAKRGAGDPALKSHVYTKDEYSNYSDLNATPTLWVNGKLKNTYPRILIRNKHPEAPKKSVNL